MLSSTQPTLILPDVRILAGMNNSYINIRHEDWNYKLDDANPRLTSTGKDKLDICTGLLKLYEKAATFDDWIQAAFECAKKEADEDAKKPENRILGFIQKKFRKTPFLWPLLYASLTYILSTLKQNKQYDLLIDSWTKERDHNSQLIEKSEQKGFELSSKTIADYKSKIELLNKNLAILSQTVPFYETFFSSVILEEESEATSLNEKSYAEYQANILNGTRKFPFYDKAMKNILVNSSQINPSQPEPPKGENPLQKEPAKESEPTQAANISAQDKPLKKRYRSALRANSAFPEQTLNSTAQTNNVAVETRSRFGKKN